MESLLPDARPAATSALHRRDEPKLWSAGKLLLLAAMLSGILSGCYFAVAIVPANLGPSAPTVQQGLLPEWIGTREILLHRGNPYRPEVTREIQAGVYGDGKRSHVNQQRFAYPLGFAFLFFPLALMPFPAAHAVGLAACLAATCWSVRLWIANIGLEALPTALVMAGVFATYPVVLGLQLCQPTLLFAGLLATAAFSVRSSRLVWGGVLTGLAMAKPQLAIAFLLPLCIWSATRWHERKRFLLALLATTVGIELLSELVVPGWPASWLTTVRAYSLYAGSAPLLRELAGAQLFGPACAFLVGTVVWVALRFGEEDLLFALSFSIAAFQLVFPFLIYNEVLLLPAALWLLKHAGAIQGRSQGHKLLWNLSWIVLASGVVAAAGLSLLDIIRRGAASSLWELPLLAAWIYPVPTFLVLAACAVPRTVKSRLVAWCA